jgi:ATP synthase protein I
MTPRPPKPDPLQEAVTQREQREAEFRAEGDRAPWQNIALIGSLAWLVVVPILGGVLLGRWLDRLTGHLVLFSAVGIVLGAGFGFWMAWQRANRE